jgi:muramoyltetrapeptide carboxypeptidase
MMLMKSKARPLRTGDRVGVVTPAGPVLQEHISHGCAVLESWGLQVEISPGALALGPRGYLAGPDERRAAALQAILDDEGIAGVFCTRGGYGTMRLLPLLDFGQLRSHPKLLVGFSDITALHLCVAGVHGIPTLHGPVLKSFAKQAEDLEDLREALFGERLIPAERRCTPVRAGRAQGVMIGGNLSVVNALLDSPFCPSLKNMILFLEEVTEADYRLDRLFTSLRLSRRAQGVRGLVLGGFESCGGVYVSADEVPDLVRDLGQEFGEAIGCPVVMDFPAGHGQRNLTIPMGVPVEIDGENGTLRYLEDACGRRGQK